MNGRAGWIVGILVVVALIAAGLWYAHSTSPSLTGQDEAVVRSVVNQFGQNLKMVSLLAPRRRSRERDG